MDTGNHQLARCSACGLIYTADFCADETSYIERDYFTEKNQYVAKWDNFASLFETLVQKISQFKPNGSLLDVGAGVGTLMSVASHKGFNVKGVEISAWASAFAREEKGLDVITGTLDDARLPDCAFDVVIVNHVLEHVESPRLFLAEIYRILKDDGMLVIGVPNVGSLMAHLKGGQWVSLRPEEHLWHFSPTTLRQLINSEKFVECYFEARENYEVLGWGWKEQIVRVINAIASLTNRGEAMLFFATKNGETWP